jgi:flagellar motility protein MotE (MotC chaperone)
MSLRLRLFPALIIGAAGLLVMKIAELATRDMPTIMEPAPRVAQVPSGAAKLPQIEPMFTGSTAKPEEKKPEPPPLPPAGQPVNLNAPATSAAERALLERLGLRRQQLEERQRELDTRESLLKAADKKLEMRINELRELEQKSTQTQPQREAEQASLKNIVTMYETMKPKEAARVFDKLDMKVLVPVATAINPRKMAEILAAMTPEAATRLTIELAVRNKRVAGAAPAAPAMPSNELQAIDPPTRP